jgi:hypothetical protein
MNRKNLILTMLACLNCVHTTHAVESTPKATQEVDSQTMDKLRILWAFQNRRCNDVSPSDAVQKAIPKDALLEGMRDIINCLHSLPETVLTKDCCRGVTKMLEDKTQELCETGQITDPVKEEAYKALRAAQYLCVDYGTMSDNTVYDAHMAVFNAYMKTQTYTNSLHPPRPYTDMLRTAYPDLAQCLEVTHLLLPLRMTLKDMVRSPDTRVMETALRFDAAIGNLGSKYPDIAKQVVDWDKAMLAKELISDIKNGAIAEEGQHLGELLERLGASNSKIAQEAWNTILNTIRHSLSGEDQDLREKMQTLWEYNPVLRQEIRKIESRIDKMTLAKTVKQTRALGKVKAPMFPDIAKYL